MGLGLALSFRKKLLGFTPLFFESIADDGS